MKAFLEMPYDDCHTITNQNRGKKNMCRMIMGRSETLAGKFYSGDGQQEVRVHLEWEEEFEGRVLRISGGAAEVLLNDGIEVTIPLWTFYVEQPCGECDGFIDYTLRTLPAPDPRDGTSEEELEMAREMTARIIAWEGKRVLGVIWFGSRVRGTHESDSDCNLLVIARDPVEDWVEEGNRLTNDLKEYYSIWPNVCFYSASFFTFCMAEEGRYIGPEAVRTGITLYRDTSGEESPLTLVPSSLSSPS